MQLTAVYRKVPEGYIAFVRGAAWCERSSKHGALGWTWVRPGAGRKTQRHSLRRLRGDHSGTQIHRLP